MSLETILTGLAAKADAATEGPWEAYRRHDRDGRRDLIGVCPESAGDIDRDVVESADLLPADAEFMALSRSAVPALVGVALDVLDEETARRLVAVAHGADLEDFEPDPRLVERTKNLLRHLVGERLYPVLDDGNYDDLFPVAETPGR